jgi:hypothetical protein
MTRRLLQAAREALTVLLEAADVAPTWHNASHVSTLGRSVIAQLDAELAAEDKPRPASTVRGHQQQTWCSCDPTRCQGVGRCRWQAMNYSPLDAIAQPADAQPVAQWVRDDFGTDSTKTARVAPLLPPVALATESCADNDSPWLICKTCATSGRCERQAFEVWFYASKYAQVAPPTKAQKQVAWDGWQAARAAPPPQQTGEQSLSDAQCDDAIRKVGLWQLALALPQNLALLRALARAGYETAAQPAAGQDDNAKDAARLDAMAANPRWHLDCEVLKFGKPGKWRVWKLLGNQEHSTSIKTLGEGDTLRAAIDSAISETTAKEKT